MDTRHTHTQTQEFKQKILGFFNHISVLINLFFPFVVVLIFSFVYCPIKSNKIRMMKQSFNTKQFFVEQNDPEKIMSIASNIVFAEKIMK